MWSKLPIVLFVPLLMGAGGDGREALERAFHNLYGADMLAAYEFTIERHGAPRQSIGLAYARAVENDTTRTLVYTRGGRRALRLLIFQEPGENHRVYIGGGSLGRARPLATRSGRLAFFDTDFTFRDLVAKRSEDYRVEPLGADRIDGEPTRALRLVPERGPYEMLVVWISRTRPVIVRIDYFDRHGLWKRYRADVSRIRQHLEWWVPMEDEMFDLRTGRRTRRKVHNILMDTDVPLDTFSVTNLAHTRLPSF